MTVSRIAVYRISCICVSKNPRQKSGVFIYRRRFVVLRFFEEDFLFAAFRFFFAIVCLRRVRADMIESRC